jgi:hypothetical protein
MLGISLCILSYEALQYTHYTMDDAFISFRYAGNLSEGQGFTWNPGEKERVEGYSNFLWIVLLSPVMKIGADPVIASKIVGVVFGICCLFVLFHYRALVSSHPAVAALPPLFTVLYPQWGIWNVGGLETPMFGFLLAFAAMRFLAELRDDRTFPWSAFLFALLALTRSEGAVYFGAALVFLTFFRSAAPGSGRSHRRRDFLWIVLFLAMYLPYFAWRFSTYGYLFPNTYYAKRVLLGGMGYLGDFTLATIPLLAAGVVGLVGRDRTMPVFLILLLLAASLPVANIEPQMGEFHRFMVPVIPLLAVLAARGVHVSRERFGRRVSLLLSAAVIASCALYGLSQAGEISRRSGIYAAGLRQAHIALGKHLGEVIPAGSIVALADCGAIPYYSGLPALDTWGLLNSEKTHDPGYSAEDVLDQDPEVIILQSYSGEDLLTPWKLEKQIHDSPRFRKGYLLMDRYTFSRRYWLWVFRKAG